MKHEIDYSSPTHRLNEVLFDVKLQDIESRFKFPDTLFSQPIYTPHYKAIVNQNEGKIISVVASNYKLISHKEAMEMGKELFAQLYPEVNPNELVPYKVIAPSSKASAHIDLIHRDVNFEVFKQDYWLPFLRVTNSYNRSYALSFEIGFVRELCSNGVIFQKDTMKLKYFHNNSNKINLQNDANRIISASKSFRGQCEELKNISVPKELVFAFVCQILGVNLTLPEKKQFPKKLTYLKNLYNRVKILTDLYFNLLGSNAYAVFNVVTDLVSHEEEYKNFTGYYLSVRSFFARPTSWMVDFLVKHNQPEFDINIYIEKTTENLELIKDYSGFVWYLN